MRIAIAALVFCALPAAYCQSVQTLPPLKGDNPFTRSSSDLGTMLQQRWQMTSVKPPASVLMNAPETSIFTTPPEALKPKPLGDAKIDPGMIIRPARSRVGDQSQGTMIAENQYKGLQFLPIEWPKFKLEPIPITWPQLKMQPIPSGCPGCAMVAVDAQQRQLPAK